MNGFLNRQSTLLKNYILNKYIITQIKQKNKYFLNYL